MNKYLKSLAQLSENETARIYDINGGQGFQRKLNSMALGKIRELKFYQNNLLEDL